jgi:hypothetical protein
MKSNKIQPLNTKNTNDDFWNYLLFFVWPIIGFFVSIRRFHLKSASVIIMLFYGMFGYTMLFSPSTDSDRQMKEFNELVYKPFSDFFEQIFGLYSSEDAKPDFFMDLIMYSVSRVTDNYRFYFMVMAFFIGYMVIKNVKVFYELYLKKENKIALIFIVFFFILNPPGRIMSFRHYLSLLVFVYAMYQYFKTNNYKDLLLLTGVVFVHFGYLMVVPLFYLYRVLGNRNKIYYVVIALSFVFFDQAANLIRDSGIDLEGSLDQTVQGYTNEEYLEEMSNVDGNQMALVGRYIRWTTLFFLFSTLYHKFQYKTFDETGEKLYSFSLVVFAFVNFMQGMESVSNRFGLVYQCIVCVFYIHIYSSCNFKYNKWFMYLSILFVGINFSVIFRTNIEYANFLMITPLYLLSFVADSDLTLLNLIK